MVRAGQWGEAEVARLLESWGLEIWGRNVRLGPLELDIVALEGPVVVVVEVRTRRVSGLVSPFASLTPKKRLRFRRAGERLWARYFRMNPRVERLRYDVAAVYTEGAQHSIEYHRGFFTG